MTTKGAAAKAAGAAIELYSGQQTELTRVRAEVGAALDRVRVELEAALGVWSLAALPDGVSQRLGWLDGLAPSLGLVELRTREESLLPARRERLGQVEGEPDWVARESLLNGYDGELGRGISDLARRCEEMGERRDALDGCKTFLFALTREAERGEGLTSFQSFWRALTFSSAREERARAASCQKFASPDWASLRAEYSELYEALGRELPRLAELREREARLRALMAERDELVAWTERFEESLVAALRERLREQSRMMSLRPFCLSSSHPLAISAGTVEALRAKTGYLESLQTYLESEIMDRMGRVKKLQRVRANWQRRSYELMRGDKTKWLVTVPAIKGESTEKCCRWSRRIAQNLEGYSDYGAFAAYLAELPNLLAWDAFAYGSVESMPYEGFTRTVMMELDQARRRSGAAKADYGPFKAVDKKRGALARDPLQEQGSYVNPVDDMPEGRRRRRRDDDDSGWDGDDGTYDDGDSWGDSGSWGGGRVDEGDLAAAAVVGGVAIGGAAYYASTHSHSEAQGDFS